MGGLYHRGDAPLGTAVIFCKFCYQDLIVQGILEIDSQSIEPLE